MARQSHTPYCRPTLVTQQAPYHKGACCRLPQQWLYQFDLPNLGREGREQMRPRLGDPNAGGGNHKHDQRNHDCYDEGIFDQRAAGAVTPQTQEPSPPAHFANNCPTPNGIARQKLGDPNCGCFARKTVKTASLPSAHPSHTACIMHDLGQNPVAI
jgi:hypothetical protein